MKSTYQKQFKLIKDRVFFDSLNVVEDYSEYQQASEFDYIFEYISKAFTSEAQKYKLLNPIFLFNNLNTLNACAIKNKEVGIVIFNRGLVLILQNEILENEKLKEFNRAFSKTSEYLQIKIEELIYQFTYLFTFYHEFAHLLQNNDFALNMSEENQQLHKDILQSHYKELDADAYSAVHLARHINEYCVKKFDLKILKECIIGVTAVFCSNLLYHLMRFPSAKKQMYYEENSHPHSFIRVLNIIAIITKYINQDVNLIERGIQISKEDLFEPIVDEVTRLQNIYENHNIELFKETVVEDIEKITSYIEKVSINKSAKINSAIDIYNDNIPSMS